MSERPLTHAQNAERSISKKYRKTLWNPFVACVKRYRLIAEGDKLAVPVSGSAESLLSAVLVRMLCRYSDFPFSAVFFGTSLDPGLKENAQALEFNLIFPGDVTEEGLIRFAAHDGCTKLVLHDCLDDAAETALSSMLFEGTLHGMMPKEKSEGSLGLIRPLYGTERGDISAWIRYNGLCPVPAGEKPSNLSEAERILRELEKTNPDVKKSIWNSLHALHRDTFPGYLEGGVRHSFLEKYEYCGRKAEKDCDAGVCIE